MFLERNNEAATSASIDSTHKNLPTTSTNISKQSEFRGIGVRRRESRGVHTVCMDNAGRIEDEPSSKVYDGERSDVKQGGDEKLKESYMAGRFDVTIVKDYGATQSRPRTVCHNVTSEEF